MPPDDLPALLGGPATRPQGPPAWPPPDPDILEALQAAYHDGSWGTYHGGRCDLLAEALRSYHGVEHVLLCGSGTYAVELALRALQVGPGDEVVLAGYDYGGNFLAVHAVGAYPVLIDVAPHNWNLALDHLGGGLGKNVKAIIASHLHGGFVPMRALMACAADCGLGVIEDAAQCPGAKIEGKSAGTWGDVGILSFGGSKLLSAGRGGALLTARAVLQQRARTQLARGNIVCPLSELQAAVLLPQLRKLDARNRLRLQNARALCRALADVPGLVPFRNLEETTSEPGYYKVGFQFDAQAFGLSRARFVEALRAEGIAFDQGFAGLFVGRSPKRFRRGSPLTEAQRAHDGAVVLHHPVLLAPEEEVAQVARAVARVHAHREKLTLADGDGTFSQTTD
jgi:perosamine synthetase